MKQILITGCTRGLGYNLLEHYLADGWTVFPVVRATGPIAHFTEVHPSRCIPIHCDITDADICEKIQAVLRNNNAELSVLINNAGTGGRRELNINDVDIAFLSSMISTHCVGAISVARAALPFLSKRSASVINISSRLGSATRNGHKEFAGLGFSYSYRIAKASQNMATLCMSQDMAFDGITVCAIHPGRLQTESGALDADTEPSIAATRMKLAIEALTSKDNGLYIDLENGSIPW